MACGKDLHYRGSMEDYSLLEKPDTWSGQENKKGVEETIHDEETAARVPCPPIGLVGED